MFSSANYLVTVHDGSLPVIASFFEECKKDAKVRTAHFSGTAAQIFFELLHRLEEAIFPSLLHINEDINAVDRQLFTPTPEPHMAEEILRLKTNIVTFRRTMQGHRTVLDRLVMVGGRDLQLSHYQHYITELRESTNEIWHMLESQRESIDALHQTNESILSLRTNEIMRMLTIISVVTFPLTLIASLFGIQAEGTPFLHSPWGFFIIVTGTVVLAGSMVGFFKYKKWL
jgi:magnesium transporter